MTSRVVADASSFRAQAASTPPPLPARSEDEDPRYVLPIDEDLVTDKLLTKPHHNYPAWDLAMPVGTEVGSVTAGHVTGVTSGGRCGTGVQVVGVDGFTYLYCHGSLAIAGTGDEVEPGDLIMMSGNTGRSTGPHLHLQIRKPAGALVCPQDVLPAWAEGDDISPAEAGETGCFYRSADHDQRDEEKDDKSGAKAKKLAAADKKKKKNNDKSKGQNSAPPKPASPGPKPGPKPGPPSPTPPAVTPSPSPSSPPTPEVETSPEPQDLESVSSEEDL